MTATTVIFVGPTLPVSEVRTLAPAAEVAPPVAAFDVLRRLTTRPPARLAIIDGYFERMAAVWHKELLLALEVGVEVWGAASMGALRAAELDGFGMRGVGAIYRAYRRGRLRDDAEVAVAHLPAEGGYQPISVALVEVRATLAAARAARVVTPAQARDALAAAQATPYWDRTWDSVDAAVPATARRRFVTWRAAHPCRPKADDARLLLATLAATPIQPRAGARVPRTWAFRQALAQVAAGRRYRS